MFCGIKTEDILIKVEPSEVSIENIKIEIESDFQVKQELDEEVARVSDIGETTDSNFNSNTIKQEEGEDCYTELPSNYVEIKVKQDLSSLDESELDESILNHFVTCNSNFKCTLPQEDSSEFTQEKYDPLQLPNNSQIPRSTNLCRDEGQGEDDEQLGKKGKIDTTLVNLRPDMRFPCEHCDKKFLDTLTLFYHQQKCHSEFFMEEDDGVDNDPERYVQYVHLQHWIYERTLYRSAQSNRNEFQYRCMTCGKNFKSPFSVTGHIATIHVGDKTGHYCKSCKTTFESREALHAHDCDKPFRLFRRSYVDYCGRGLFKYKGKLEYREIIHNINGADVESYKCSTCDLELSTQFKMYDHIERFHCLGGDLTCSRCKRSFSTEDQKADHHCTKYEIKMFTRRKWTEESEGKFVSDDNWSYHLEGNRYACDHCSAKMKTMYRIKGHIHRSHGEKNRFQCPTCGKGFAVPSTYEKHVTIHQKKKFNKRKRSM